MNQYNLIIYYHHFKNIVIDIYSFKGFVYKLKRKIRVKDFGERKGDGMVGDELDHFPQRIIVIHGVYRKQLVAFSENDLSL